ncbi:TIGR01621 family pseudouridine synthase [Paraglaciecola arctica]|uniref:TIGR01621 family pseudouridine synthase n=1 Tax=Paraglaciecola arctica TaxID=1128911 RepID=UPI001C076451|nr:TIGR01621 family pseudouridine synthase [Paraglaciecola arctica]MBU3003335.1 TIGR01621 family pseudouridine synthase [Paraglaciecola arctica]
MSASIEVLFDHPDFVIVNKPYAISVQNETQQSGILPMLCQQLNVEKLWLVHRLDKITSGILILAKNPEAASVFGHLFEHKHIEKYYLALSSKKPKKKQGTVTGGMKKVRDGKWMLDTSKTSAAVSQFFSFATSPGLRLFLVKPLTGKTHQIRVALKSIGSPILGDSLYKGESSDRTYLHAYCIRFAYQQQPICVMCPPTIGKVFLRAETQQQIAKLTTPWALNWPVNKYYQRDHAQ